MNKIKLYHVLPWSYPINIITNFKGIVKSISRFYMRGRYGTSHWDCYNLNNYMLQVFKNGLEIFREDTIAYPPKLTPSEWDNVLKRMEELIEIVQIDPLDDEEVNKFWDLHKTTQDDFFRKEMYKAVKKINEEKQDALNELCDLIKEWNDNLWW